eukprot:3725929-Alexandrium_andersonii.AAC.1
MPAAPTAPPRPEGAPGAVAIRESQSAGRDARKPGADVGEAFASGASPGSADGGGACGAGPPATPPW